jgi:hypothetical protein
MSKSDPRKSYLKLLADIAGADYPVARYIRSAHSRARNLAEVREWLAHFEDEPMGGQERGHEHAWDNPLHFGGPEMDPDTMWAMERQREPVIAYDGDHVLLLNLELVGSGSRATRRVQRFRFEGAAGIDWDFLYPRNAS